MQVRRVNIKYELTRFTAFVTKRAEQFVFSTQLNAELPYSRQQTDWTPSFPQISLHSGVLGVIVFLSV